MFDKPKLLKEKLSRARRLRRQATPQEVILWSRLRSGRFYGLKFRRQHPLGRYVVDFICLEKKLIIELDGWQHKEERREWYDQERSTWLQSLGFRVLRFWNNEVNDNLNGVMLKIEEVVSHS
jgi:very-short-patch-repair endonuclease